MENKPLYVDREAFTEAEATILNGSTSSGEVIRELTKTKTLLENILEGSLAGYWVWDMKEDSMFLSPTFKRMLGYEPDELTNPDTDIWQRLMHPQDVPGAYILYNEHLKSRGKTPYENEVRYYHKNGSIVWVYCKGKVIEWNEHWVPLRMVGCHVDITQLKKSETAQKLAVEMEHKIQELEQFAFITSHDLKAPLNAIKGFVHLLQRSGSERLGATDTNYLDNILANVSHMSELIHKLLQYSRLGKGRVMSLVNCNTLMQEVIERLNDSIKLKKAKIRLTALPEVNAYKNEVSLLLYHLLDNALKFSQPTKQPKIEISAIEDGSYWRFSIKDNGIGIAPEYQDKIFMIFQRLHLQKEYEGIGMGLAQCQKIVEHIHKGKIWVESNGKDGSNFMFLLPK